MDCGSGAMMASVLIAGDKITATGLTLIGMIAAATMAKMAIPLGCDDDNKNRRGWCDCDFDILCMPTRALASSSSHYCCLLGIIN